MLPTYAFPDEIEQKVFQFECVAQLDVPTNECSYITNTVLSYTRKG